MEIPEMSGNPAFKQKPVWTVEMFARFFPGFGAFSSTNTQACNTTPRTRGSKRQNNYGYDSLEPRQMLAATISHDDATGIVTVTGTTGADVVTVTETMVEAVVSVQGGESLAFDIETLFLIEFYGGAGDDIFDNQSFVDARSFGQGGNDTLLGGGGYDYIHGGTGDDILNGNFGDDEIFGHDGVDVIDGGGDDDFVLGGRGNDQINGGDGDDHLGGDWDDDTISGGNGDDFILGFTGLDFLYGDDGDDRIYGQASSDHQFGGSGFDTVRGGPDEDFLYGGDGNDYIQGDQANDLLDGGDGQDVLIGFTGDDFLSGGNGDDFLYGQQDNDEIHGGDGEDRIRGHEGNDLIYGGADYDFIDGDSGNDELHGGEGADRILGDLGDDLIFAGEGEDTVFGHEGNDVIRGGLDFDVILGGDGDDSIHGGVDVNDSLQGDAGADRFLVRSTDLVVDQTADDARIVFVNETSAWTDAEISVLDEGFAQLVETTGNTTLLKDSLPSGDLTFYKYHDLGNAAGINYLSYTFDGTNYEFTREIRIVDWDETNPWWNDQFRSVALHEIAHNWDSDFELGFVDPNLDGEIEDFRALSGWTDTDPNSSDYTLSADGQWWYLNTSSFAESYGETNPYEDVATVWEFYFSGNSTNDPGLQAKLDHLDDLFAQLS